VNLASLGPADEHLIPLEVQKQERDNWCWAAVSVGLGTFFGTPHGAVSQCDLASRVLNKPCCLDADACNQTWALRDALRVAGMRCSWRFRLPPFSELAAGLRGNEPYPVQLEWRRGGHHVVLVVGYLASTTQFLVVADPASGAPPRLVPYDPIIGPSPSGEWTWTFSVAPL
jgi:hypothetical protein